MKNTVLVLGLVLAMAFGTEKRAEACGGGGGNMDGLIAGILVVGGTYAGVTVGMGIKDLSSDDHSVGYGVAEAVIHTPIALLWGAAAMTEMNRDTSYGGDSHTTGFVIMTAIHGALAAHGIYTIAKRREPKRERGMAPSRPYQGPPGMFSVGRVSANIAPAPLHNGAGLGLSGAF